MPEIPITLRLPPQCPQCDAFGTVTLRHHIAASQLMLKWYCFACRNEWPVRRKDQQTAPRSQDQQTAPRSQDWIEEREARIADMMERAQRHHEQAEHHERQAREHIERAEQLQANAPNRKPSLTQSRE